MFSYNTINIRNNSQDKVVHVDFKVQSKGSQIAGDALLQYFVALFYKCLFLSVLTIKDKVALQQCSMELIIYELLQRSIVSNWKQESEDLTQANQLVSAHITRLEQFVSQIPFRWSYLETMLYVIRHQDHHQEKINLRLVFRLAIDIAKIKGLSLFELTQDSAIYQKQNQLACLILLQQKIMETDYHTLQSSSYEDLNALFGSAQNGESSKLSMVPSRVSKELSIEYGLYSQDLLQDEIRQGRSGQNLLHIADGFSKQVHGGSISCLCNKTLLVFLKNIYDYWMVYKGIQNLKMKVINILKGIIKKGQYPYVKLIFPQLFQITFKLIDVYGIKDILSPSLINEMVIIKDQKYKQYIQWLISGNGDDPKKQAQMIMEGNKMKNSTNWTSIIDLAEYFVKKKIPWNPPVG